MTRERDGRWTLTQGEREAVNRFIFGALLYEGPPPINGYGVRGITREQHSQSYQSWARGGRRAWGALHQGGTGQLATLAWYQHVYRPGSREWRPAKIIPSLVSAALAWIADKPTGAATATTNSTPSANSHSGRSLDGTEQTGDDV